MTEHFTFCVGGIEAPTVTPTDEIQVWYYEAPVFEGEYGNLFTTVDAYHTGFGFIDLTTKLNYTFEYDAYSEVLNATIPFVINGTNGTKELLWMNKGAVCVIPSVNISYWDHKRTLLTLITGQQFNQFSMWTKAYNESNPVYELWTVWDIYPNNSLEYAALDCTSFNWAGFDYLHRIGAEFNLTDGYPSHTYVALYSNPPPAMVDMSNETIYNDVIAFYSEFENFTTISDILTLLAELADRPKYLYYGGAYYKLFLSFPYFYITYFPTPYPWITTSTNNKPPSLYSNSHIPSAPIKNLT